MNVGKPFQLLLIAALLITILLTVSCGGATESTTTTTGLITTTTTPTPTTTNAQPTIQPTTTNTQTTIQPTTTTPTPTTTNNEPAVCSVLDLILPSSGPADEPFTISIIVTNTGGSQGSCDIPINITDTKNPTNITTYILSVTLDAGETKEFPFNGVDLPEGDYTAIVGGISKYLKVS
jgi:hypothetical protein